MDNTTTFCTHAIESFQALRGNFMRGGWKEDAESLDWIIKVLRTSIKFKIPDGGRLIDKKKGTQHFCEMLRLPFNEVALEYSMIGEAVEGAMPCSRRIALCLSSESSLLHPSMAKVLAKDGRTGIFVISLFRDDIEKMWRTCGTGGFLQYGHYAPEGRRPTDTFMNHMRQMGYPEKDASNDVWEMETFNFLPNGYKTILEATGYDSTIVSEKLLADNVDELMSAIDFCAIMNCSNVQTEIVPAPEKLNKKRITNDKPPMFEYRVLVLESDGDGIVRSFNSSGPGGQGGRSSPRLHVRRGHIRKLKENTIWINQMTVGAAHLGVINKEYKITNR